MNPFLKFVTPALVAIAGMLITAIQQGTFNGPAFEVGFVGLAAASIAFLVSNGPTGLRAYAKALAPALVTLTGVGIHYIVAGVWNAVDTRAAVAGGLAALLTLVVPNAPTPAPASAR